METEFRFGIWERLGIVALLAGVAGILVSIAFPLAYPESPISIEGWRAILWVSTFVLGAAVIFFVCDLSVYIASRKGVRLGLVLVSIGTILIIVGAIVGFVGAFKIDHPSKTVTEERPGPLAGLTNSQLRERTIAFAQSLRDLQGRYDSESNQMQFQSWVRRRSTSDENEKLAMSREEEAQSMLLRDKLEMDFRNKYRSDGLVLREELRKRLKTLPMPTAGTNTDVVRRQFYSQIFDKPFLSGPSPLSGAADLLEYWAKLLP